MNRFIINRPPDFDAAVTTLVRQTFPAATPTSSAMEILDGNFRISGGTITSRIEGSRRERFTWGFSRIGGSFLIG